MFKLITKLSKERIIEIFCYINLLVNFIGVDFLDFKILNVNFNFGRILMILSIIPFLICVHKIGIKRLICENSITVKRVLIFLIVWTLFTLISFFYSKDLFSTIIYEFFFIFGTINILLLVSMFDSKEKLINVFKIIEISIVVNSIYSLYMYFFKNKLYGAFYSNVNDLSTFFLIAIPVELFLLINLSNKKSAKIFRSIVFFMLIYTFWILDSRACKIGLMIGIVCVILFIIYKKNIKLQSIFMKIYSNKNIFMFLVILIFIIMIVTLSIGIKDNFIPKTTNLDSNSVRVNLIYNAFHFLKDHFLFGIGSGNIGYYLENYAIYPTKNITNMHNYWVEILVDYGIFIFLAFIISYFIVFIKLSIRYINSKEPKEAYMYLAILFFVSAFILGSISSSTNLTKEWLWLITGIVLAVLNMNYKITKYKGVERINDRI